MHRAIRPGGASPRECLSGVFGGELAVLSSVLRKVKGRCLFVVSESNSSPSSIDDSFVPCAGCQLVLYQLCHSFTRCHRSIDVLDEIEFQVCRSGVLKL
jgi:hypothetical protein